MATGGKCFVLMSFDDNRKEVYKHAIVPAAETVAFECHRADTYFLFSLRSFRSLSMVEEI